MNFKSILNTDENIELEVRDVKKVLSKIQRLEPPGIGARSLEECLLIQINAIEELDDIKLIAKEILTHSFDEFKKKQFDKIYEKINESKEKIKLAIKNLSKGAPNFRIPTGPPCR